MKNRKIVTMMALLIASLTAAQATTITDWTFDNDGLGNNANPAPSVGSGTASTVGLTTSLTTPPSISNPDIIANPESGSDSTPATDDSWRIRGNGSSPNNGNGWTTNAAIGTQGAEFTASTVGFDNIQITFDIAPTTKGTAFMQVEYTLDDTATTVTWVNATLSYSADPSLILNNSTPASGGNGLIVGSYIDMIGASQWYNDVTADLSGVSGANNNPNFAIEIVNAAEGTSDLAANNALVGNSGNLSLDNIQVTGSAVPEPTALALAGLGLTGLLGFCRARKHKG